MRSFATSLIALVVSLFVGMLIAQVLAVETGGGEEWIVVFGMTVLVAAAVTLVFFIVQLASGSRAAAVTALVLLVVFLLLAGALLAVTFWTNGPDNAGSDLPIIAGLVLPGVAIILVQWLIVRWRAPRLASEPAAPRFGRGDQPS